MAKARKKGQGGIISVVLIIVLVLAAIVVLGNVVFKLLNDKASETGKDYFSITLDSPAKPIYYAESPYFVQVKVHRAGAKGNLSGIKFILKDNNNKVYTITRTNETIDMPDVQETKNYKIETSELGDFTPQMSIVAVQFVPVFRDSKGKEYVGILSAEYSARKTNSMQGIPVVCTTRCTGDMSLCSENGLCGNSCTTGIPCGNSCVNINGDDADNCGSCGNECPDSNELNKQGSCSGGVCGYEGDCLMGYGDCDHEGYSCEINLNTNFGYCGDCEINCAVGGGYNVCNSGTCEYSCGSLTDCGGGCFDLGYDANNCGSCGYNCVNYGYNGCLNSVCVNCGDTELCSDNIDNDCDWSIDEDCSGLCDTDQDGHYEDLWRCIFTSPRDDCNDDNANINPDASESCNDNIDNDCDGSIDEDCGCASGSTDCNGACFNLNNDVNNCGSCGIVCPHYDGYANMNDFCSSGSCSYGCSSGYSDCNSNINDGCEVYTSADTNNCGGCGTVCSWGANMASISCNSGTCDGICNSGYADCNSNKPSDGCEIDINYDASNCGSCGNACSGYVNGYTSCSSTSCGGGCYTGQTYCSGTCIDLNSDFNNCGSCGAVCLEGQYCSSRSCNW